MYWAIESADVANFIFGSLPSDFDDDDRADWPGSPTAPYQFEINSGLEATPWLRRRPSSVKD